MDSIELFCTEGNLCAQREGLDASARAVRKGKYFAIVVERAILSAARNEGEGRGGIGEDVEISLEINRRASKILYNYNSPV